MQLTRRKSIVDTLKVETKQRPGTVTIRIKILPQIDIHHAVNRMKSYIREGGHSSTLTDPQIMGPVKLQTYMQQNSRKSLLISIGLAVKESLLMG